MRTSRLIASRAHLNARAEQQLRAFRGAASPWICLSAVLSASALADQAPHPRTVPVDRTLEEIVVTGTRLRISSIDATLPVTVLSRRDIERGGADSIGKILQTLPAITGSQLNTNVNAGGGMEPSPSGGGSGDGSVRASLRGGSLVLLNGRRFPNGGIGADTAVDLNTIPVSLIERVEVLTGGASAAYGSDAVGGVINIVTRRAGRGVELTGSRTIAAQGDGEIVTAQAAIGLAPYGGAWSIGVDYAKQEGVTLDRRDYSAVPLFIVDAAGNVALELNNATPQGSFRIPEGNALGLAAGAYTLVEGATGHAAEDYRPYDRSVDGFNPAPFNYSQTPNERTSLWLLGSQPVGDRVQLFAEGLVQHRSSEQELAPDFFARSMPLPTLADGSEGIPADNYYNPFGVDLPLPPRPPVRRRLAEAGNRTVSEDVDLWRVLVGLEGEAGAAWRWQASAGYAESDATTFEKGFMAWSRYPLALGPSGPDQTGRIVCGPPDPATGRVPAASIIPGCVPLNFFGGAGSVTQDQLDYMSPRPMTDTGTNEQRIAELVFRGPWGRLASGDVQWLVGTSYRREGGSLVQDPLRELEFLDLSGSTVSAGHYDAKELFAEAELPLLRDRPGAHRITLDLGVRWSDFSTFGPNTAWQAGLRWQPKEEWALRTRYAQVFAAPSLPAVHDPLIHVPYEAIDPCGNNPTPEQRVNCAANGVPGGAYVQSDPEFLVTAGGNPDLQPETGHTFGAGVIYTPASVEGLSVSVDYSRVVIRGFVTQAFPEQVLLGCADYGTREWCDAIDRLPDGSISRVYTPNENFGYHEDRAFDVAIDWHGATRLGEVTAAVQTTYLDRWDDQYFPDEPVSPWAGKAGVGALPRWQALGSIDWRHGRWLASYAAEYIGSYTELVEPALTFVFAPYSRSIDAVLYHDVEAGFEFDSGFALRAVISNVLDEDPPYVNGGSIANTDEATYRLLGRSYFVEMRYRLQ